MDFIEDPVRALYWLSDKVWPTVTFFMSMRGALLFYALCFSLLWLLLQYAGGF